MNVPVQADGSVTIAAGLSKPGDYVEMIAERAVVAMLPNCAQANNPCSGFGPTAD
jgi:uncharacterized protein YcgI (DUF1989 family)